MRIRFTATAVFEIHGTIEATDEDDARTKLNDMQIAVYDSHCRTVNTEIGPLPLQQTVHYPPTVGVYEPDENIHVEELGDDPHIIGVVIREEEP